MLVTMAEAPYPLTLTPFAFVVARQDYCCGWCKTGHNDWYTLIVYWILPNGLWILFPAIIAYIFVKELSTTLKVAAGVQGATALSHPIPSATNGAIAADVNRAKAAAGDADSHAAHGSNPYLVDHSQLPSWAQDNAWIVRGYRRPGGAPHPDPSLKTFDHGTVYKCWRSIWAYWHNETGKFFASSTTSIGDHEI